MEPSHKNRLRSGVFLSVIFRAPSAQQDEREDSPLNGTTLGACYAWSQATMKGSPLVLALMLTSACTADVGFPTVETVTSADQVTVTAGVVRDERAEEPTYAVRLRELEARVEELKEQVRAHGHHCPLIAVSDDPSTQLLGDPPPTPSGEEPHQDVQ